MSKPSLHSFVKNPSIAAACILSIALVAASAVYSTAGTTNASMPAPPTPVTIGLVDIAKLMNSLQELNDRNELVKVKRNGLQNKLDELSAESKAIAEQIKTVIPASDKKARREAMAKGFENEATYDARVKAYQNIIEHDNGEILGDVYPKVVDAIKRYATKEGFDLVMFDDRPMPLPDSGTTREYNDVIQRKRLLFARDGLDITTELITMMNNEYAAALNQPRK